MAGHHDISKLFAAPLPTTRAAGPLHFRQDGPNVHQAPQGCDLDSKTGAVLANCFAEKIPSGAQRGPGWVPEVLSKSVAASLSTMHPDSDGAIHFVNISIASGCILTGRPQAGACVARPLRGRTTCAPAFGRRAVSRRRHCVPRRFTPEALRAASLREEALRAEALRAAANEKKEGRHGAPCQEEGEKVSCTASDEEGCPF